MKAKFINEVLNFERGKDPKEYLKIGKLIKYKNLFKDLHRENPVYFPNKILDLGITNEIPVNRIEYILPEIYEILKSYVNNNPYFEFVDVKRTSSGVRLFIKERNNSIKETLNFNRGEESFDKLKIGRKNIDLKFEVLKKGENYLATILGADENEEDLECKERILDKDNDSILVCDLNTLTDVKHFAKQSKVKLTLEFVSEIGIENADLDELLFIYDHVDDHIETVMGYQVKFNYLE
jgi:hypothetical protein